MKNKLKIELEGLTPEILGVELAKLEESLGRELPATKRVLLDMVDNQPVDSDNAWETFGEFLQAEIDYHDKFKKEIRAKHPNLNKAICLLVATFRQEAQKEQEND